MVLFADIFEADTRTLLALSEISNADLRHEQVDRQKVSGQDATTATAANGEEGKEAADGAGEDEAEN